MAENAPYSIRNVVPAKTTKAAICSPSNFENTSPYPSDWNQRRSTQYDNPIRPQRTPKAKAIKDKILRRPHVEVRCCGESMKSGNFSPVLDRHRTNILIVGFLQLRVRVQSHPIDNVRRTSVIPSEGSTRSRRAVQWLCSPSMTLPTFDRAPACFGRVWNFG